MVKNIISLLFNLINFKLVKIAKKIIRRSIFFVFLHFKNEKSLKWSINTTIFTCVSRVRTTL